MPGKLLSTLFLAPPATSNEQVCFVLVGVLLGELDGVDDVRLVLDRGSEILKDSLEATSMAAAIADVVLERAKGGFSKFINSADQIRDVLVVLFERTFGELLFYEVAKKVERLVYNLFARVVAHFSTASRSSMSKKTSGTFLETMAIDLVLEFVKAVGVFLPVSKFSAGWSVQKLLAFSLENVHGSVVFAGSRHVDDDAFLAAAELLFVDGLNEDVFESLVSLPSWRHVAGLSSRPAATQILAKYADATESPSTRPASPVVNNNPIDAKLPKTTSDSQEQRPFKQDEEQDAIGNHTQESRRAAAGGRASGRWSGRGHARRRSPERGPLDRHHASRSASSERFS